MTYFWVLPAFSIFGIRHFQFIVPNTLIRKSTTARRMRDLSTIFGYFRCNKFSGDKTRSEHFYRTRLFFAKTRQIKLYFLSSKLKLLTLGFNSFYDARIQFLAEKWPSLITSLSEDYSRWKFILVLSRLSPFPWWYSHCDRTSNYFFSKRISFCFYFWFFEN